MLYRVPYKFRDRAKTFKQVMKILGIDIGSLWGLRTYE